MLDERRAKERMERECAVPDGPLAPAFFADGRLIAPAPMINDKTGRFVSILVDGRLCCLGEDRSTDNTTDKTTAREVLLLVAPSADGQYDDAPDCPTALRWCEFEFAVRTKDAHALAVYGLMRAALVWRISSEQKRAEYAMSEADAVFGALGAGEQ